MSRDDPFYGDEYQPTEINAATLATQLLAMGQKTPEEVSEEKLDESERIRDMALWENQLPDSTGEERFWGNLGHRLVRGIPRLQIDKMTIRDRVTSARACFDMRQIMRDRPLANINYDGRKNIMEALPALTQELERRKRERMTVDVSPNREND